MPEPTAQALSRLYQQVLTEMRAMQEVHTIPSPDGEGHDCQFYVFPITNATGERFLGGFALDVSEQRRLEDQLRQAQKMEAIGRLAGGIAHDFNNMLSVINGYSDLLLAHPDLDELTRQRLADIHYAGERAASLTRQLLAFSRQQVLEPRLFDVRDLVSDLTKLLGRVIGEDIRLVLRTADEPCPVCLDPAQVEQVLLNLAVNARDAMPKGGQLIVETSPVELDERYISRHFDVTPGSYVLLTVTDTGCGMDRATMQHAFEPFFTTKEAGKGTGLGLATVYGIVQQSGGDIHVRSTPGIGTTFRIYLPRVRQDTPDDPRASCGSHALARGTETILVVEDEEMVRGLVCHALTLSGYTVLEGATVRDAMRQCAEHPGKIDLLLTDVVMPTMSGRELAECLLHTRPEMRVLFMSGYTDDAVVQHGILATDAVLIQKPFSPTQLTRKVREVLGAQRRETASLSNCRPREAAGSAGKATMN